MVPAENVSVPLLALIVTAVRAAANEIEPAPKSPPLPTVPADATKPLADHELEVTFVKTMLPPYVFVEVLEVPIRKPVVLTAPPTLDAPPVAP